MAETDMTQETGTGRKVQPCMIAVVVLLAMGVGVKMFGDFWLAPPALRYTPLVYLFLMMGWLPVLLLCEWLDRVNGCRSVIVVLIMGMLISLFPLSDQDLSAIRTRMLDPIGVVACEVEAIVDGRARYACELHNFERPSMRLVFEGREGGIFVELVERD